MKKQKTVKTNKGITLIALVITIIVMLILVAVTISMAVNGGLFEYAGKAVDETQEAIDAEQKLADGKIKIDGKWYASIDDYIAGTPIESGLEITPTEITLKKKETAEVEGEEVLTETITASVFGMESEPEITWVESSDAITLSATTGKSVTVEAVGVQNAEATVTAKCTYEGKEYTQACKVTLEIIEKEETYIAISTGNSYVGCYADLDGDPETIEGIIYADLAKGVSGTYYSTTYSKEAETNGLKEYYVSKTAHEGTFGKDGTEVRDVITVMPNTTGVKDRFYVMALENVGSSSTFYPWYVAAKGNMSDYATTTSVNFGEGKDNTTKIIAKWDKGSGEGGYGAQGNRDMWGQIKTEVANGWFVPSKGELAAFADAFDITSSNYSSTYKLNYCYWSSSQSTDSRAWRVYFNGDEFDGNSVDLDNCVRLSTTF